MRHPLRSILPGAVLTLMIAVSASSALAQTYEEWDQALEDEFADIAAERITLEAALAD